MRINVLNQFKWNVKMENAIISLRKLKHSILRRNAATNSGRNFWGKQYCKPMERSFQCNSKFCSPMRTEIRSWMHWRLPQVIMMLLMYMSCSKLLEDCKIRRLWAMMEFHLRSISVWIWATADHDVNHDTPVYMCFLDAKRAFDRVNHWTLAKKQLHRNVPLHIVKLFIYCYRKQEFMVFWGNSLSITFRCSNGIRQGGQLSPLLYNVYTDDLNHYL